MVCTSGFCFLWVAGTTRCDRHCAGCICEYLGLICRVVSEHRYFYLTGTLQMGKQRLVERKNEINVGMIVYGLDFFKKNSTPFQNLST